MKSNRKTLLLIFFVSLLNISFGQDINFSQFYDIPMLRNPSLGGIFNGNVQDLEAFARAGGVDVADGGIVAQGGGGAATEPAQPGTTQTIETTTPDVTEETGTPTVEPTPVIDVPISTPISTTPTTPIRRLSLLPSG